MEQRNFVDGLRITRYQLGQYALGVTELDMFTKPFSGFVRASELWVVDTRLIIRAIRGALDDAVHQ